MQERRKQGRSRGPSLSSFSRTRASASKPKILPPTSHHSSGKQVKWSSPARTYSQLFIKTCTVLYYMYYMHIYIVQYWYLHTYLDCVIYQVSSCPLQKLSRKIVFQEIKYTHLMLFELSWSFHVFIIYRALQYKQCWAHAYYNINNAGHTRIII